MRERAKVVALGDGDAWVETRRRGSCGSCGSRSACGGSLTERFLPGKPHYIRALLQPGQGEALAVGDPVDVEVPDQAVLRASLIVYLLPLGLFMLGMTGGALLVPDDPGAIVGGLVGFLVGFSLVRLHARLTRDDRCIQPRLMMVPSAVPGADPVGPESIRMMEKSSRQYES